MKKLIVVLCFFVLIGCQFKDQTKEPANSNIIYGSVTVSDSLMIYSTWSKQVIVENIKSKKKLFTKQIASNCYAKPVLLNNKLYFPHSDSLFTCVNISNGETIWSRPLNGRCSDFNIVNNSIIANSKSYGLIGIAALSGNLIFEILYKYGQNCTIPDLSPYRITFDKNAFYVCDWQCTNVTAFSIPEGRLLWKRNDKPSNSNVKLIDGLIFWGMNEYYKGGQIALLKAGNGEIIYKHAVKFEDHFNPIVYQNKVYYYSYDGKLYEFDLKSKTNKAVYSFNEKNDVSGNQMYLLNDNLYYSSQGSIYRMNLKNFENKTVQTDTRDIYGVYDKEGQAQFIF